jgi:hypothetical protein
MMAGGGSTSMTHITITKAQSEGNARASSDGTALLALPLGRCFVTTPTSADFESAEVFFSEKSLCAEKSARSA